MTTIILRSPLLRHDFLDNREIVSLVEKDQTGHSGVIELLVEEAPNKEVKTGQKGIRNMEERTSYSHH